MHLSGWAYPAPSVHEAVRASFPFNVLHPASGNKIDFILPRADAWGQAQLGRRQRLNLLPDREGYAARPEDVIIGKLWYYAEGGSEKHLRDIAGILRISGATVDREDIAQWARKIGLLAVWEAVLQKLEA